MYMISNKIFNISFHAEIRKLSFSFFHKNKFRASDVSSNVTFPTLWCTTAENNLMMFFLFSQKMGFDMSCKLSPKETICMTCKSQFSGKNVKNTFVFQSVVNQIFYC